MASELKIGFLGAGKMATALAQGFLKAGLVSAGDLFASDPMETSRAAFAKAIGCATGSSNLEAARFGRVVILAVKPDQAGEVLEEVGEQLTEKQLLISIAAGVPLARLEGTLGSQIRVVRVMPNTPALVGASATA
ncbi:MAG TPA: NAD(P)-binding domain-containing protein, partial [Verrucomicrobiae bacterium]|nr:NAD(P)-binding domain-containing protein [Verrucomicrobiae bacterium]